MVDSQSPKCFSWHWYGFQVMFSLCFHHFRHGKHSDWRLHLYRHLHPWLLFFTMWIFEIKVGALYAILPLGQAFHSYIARLMFCSGFSSHHHIIAFFGFFIDILHLIAMAPVFSSLNFQMYGNKRQTVLQSHCIVEFQLLWIFDILKKSLWEIF